MLKLSRAQRPWGPEGSLGSEEDSNAHLLGTLTLLELRTSVPPVQSKLRITNALSRGNLKKGALDHECPALESGTCLQHRKVSTHTARVPDSTRRTPQSLYLPVCTAGDTQWAAPCISSFCHNGPKVHCGKGSFSRSFCSSGTE